MKIQLLRASKIVKEIEFAATLPPLEIQLGQEDLRAARDADHRGLRARRRQMGRDLRRPAQGKRFDLCRQGRSRLRQGLGRGPAEAAKAMIRKRQLYAKRIAHKGIWVEPKLLVEIEYRAKSAAGKGPAPVLQGTARGSLIGCVRPLLAMGKISRCKPHGHGPLRPGTGASWMY